MEKSCYNYVVVRQLQLCSFITCSTSCGNDDVNIVVKRFMSPEEDDLCK